MRPFARLLTLISLLAGQFVFAETIAGSENSEAPPRLQSALRATRANFQVIKATGVFSSLKNAACVVEVDHSELRDFNRVSAAVHPTHEIARLMAETVNFEQKNSWGWMARVPKGSRKAGIESSTITSRSF